MTETIYALYYPVEDQKLYFYVGRTNDVERRMGEHIRLSKIKNEDKYKFIREYGDDWDFEVLSEVEKTDNACHEQFWHLKLLSEGHPMQNMKMGDNESPINFNKFCKHAMDRKLTFKTVEEFASEYGKWSIRLAEWRQRAYKRGAENFEKKKAEQAERKAYINERVKEILSGETRGRTEKI
jgi:predicted GIY-YIG superfamily endonuclease